MAVRKGAQKKPVKPSETTSDLIEEKLVAFAEQLGGLVGTVQARAEGWLDRDALRGEIRRIRDSAAGLLAQVDPKGILKPKTTAVKRKTTVKKRAASAARPGRGPVDAPGKRHRKPLPPERIDKRMGEPEGKQMGQKSTRPGRRSMRRS